MRFGAVIAGALAGLALIGMADVAAAQSRARTPAVNLTEAANASQRTGAQPAPQRRGLRFNEDGRWGLNLNFNQPVGRESELGDVEAGAYYRLSPRLRVGAAAGLASPETDPARAPETDRRTQPRLRLESIFKF